MKNDLATIQPSAVCIMQYVVVLPKRIVAPIGKALLLVCCENYKQLKSIESAPKSLD